MPEPLPSDGRKEYEWKSGYTVDEQSGRDPSKLMKKEATYLVVLIIVACIVIVANYKGAFVSLLLVEEKDKHAITRIIYCLSAGLLGGVTFSVKVFYRAVARGLWHYDRRYWRYFSPIISLSVTSVVAIFMIDDVIGARVYWTYMIGYFAGYFSENAVGKMYDIAVVLFSSPVKEEKKGDADGKTDNKSD